MPPAHRTTSTSFLPDAWSVGQMGIWPTSHFSSPRAFDPQVPRAPLPALAKRGATDSGRTTRELRPSRCITAPFGCETHVQFGRTSSGGAGGTVLIDRQLTGARLDARRCCALRVQLWRRLDFAPSGYALGSTRVTGALPLPSIRASRRPRIPVFPGDSGPSWWR